MHLYSIFMIVFSCSSLLCYYLDIYYPQFRIQYTSKKEIIKDYNDMLPLVLFNIIITYPYFCIYDSFIKPPYNNYNFAINFIAWFTITDILFYSLHKLFHIKKLYIMFHKIHHKYKYTYGMGAIYAHPVDYVVTNLFSISFPIWFLGIPPIYTQKIILIALAYTVIISHGCFNLLKGHLQHHIKYNYNYGLGFMDKLFDTKFNQLPLPKVQ